MDCEDFTVFTDAMELHYIDMKAFAKAINNADSISINDTEEAMFTKWLSVITQKEITNKAIIENACDEEEILMAVTALQRQSEDKIMRQAYQRRKDEIYFYNVNTKKLEQATAELQQTEAELQQTEAELQQTEAELQQTEAELQQTEAALEKTATALAQAAAEIERLRSENKALRSNPNA